MNVELITAVLGWCTLFNLALLAWWALFILFAHDWTYRMHTHWFRLSEERFDSLHYALMGFFKLTIIVFNLMPYLALRVVA